jgi:hypothetical protein
VSEFDSIMASVSEVGSTHFAAIVRYKAVNDATGAVTLETTIQTASVWRRRTGQYEDRDGIMRSQVIDFILTKASLETCAEDNILEYDGDNWWIDSVRELGNDWQGTAVRIEPQERHKQGYRRDRRQFTGGE